VVRYPMQLRIIEALAQIPIEAGFSAVEALAAVDICGQALLGMANVRAAELADSEYRSVGEGQGAMSPDELPAEGYANVRRMLSETARLTMEHEFELACA